MCVILPPLNYLTLMICHPNIYPKSYFIEMELLFNIFCLNFHDDDDGDK